MADPVANYLERCGPALSSEVSAHLVETLGLTPEAARKRLSRAVGEVRRLSGVTFPHKARLMYLRQQFGSDLYWSKLVAALIQTRSAHGYAIAALQQRGGLIPERHFAIACGAPLKQSKHISPETIFARLSQAGLLSRVNLPGVGDCIALVQEDGHYESQAEPVRARLITEEMLLLAVKDWLRKLGVASYGKVVTRDGESPPRVGTFLWDLSAPCYLGPARARRPGRTGSQRLRDLRRPSGRAL